MEKAKFISEQNIKFLLHDVFNIESLTSSDYYGQHNRKLFDMVLDETLKLAKDLMWPILEEMDQNTPILENGEVKVNPAVREIMRQCGEGGWISAGFPEEYNGDQLPVLFVSACRFIFWASNYSAGTFPDLTAGAARLISSFGDQNLVDSYLPNMLAGKWQGTMALTEPQAGSSLADIAATAKSTDKGYYHLSGNKIFISAGDHNGVDNVVHLMLARMEGAPGGVKGISLFVVPKLRPEESGQLVSNDVVVSQIFHKLGYRGCPITELSIGEQGDCRGFLIGEANKGLFYMFQMMNEARIGVGLGATAIASAAYYASLDYVKQRTQGRNASHKNPDLPQVPLIEHADVKRMLLFQKSVVEGSLSLLMQASLYADLEIIAPNEEKEKYSLLLDILTPVAKTYPSEMGILSVSQGLQCLGGYGYCKDFSLEQYYRDARIHPIHEGTTGIQGQDLLGRKVLMQNGKAFDLLINEIKDTIKRAMSLNQLNGYAFKLTQSVDILYEVTDSLIAIQAEKGTESFLADAVLYLELFSIITIAWQWLKQAISACKSLDSCKSKSAILFYEGKLSTARYFFHYELPKIYGLKMSILDSGDVTLDIDPDAFK